MPKQRKFVITITRCNECPSFREESWNPGYGPGCDYIEPNRCAMLGTLAYTKPITNKLTIPSWCPILNGDKL